ncbi:MAG: trypsin-like peptidase domain-containing protein, partial [Candidatus Rokuibacteriota bacterium]
EAAKRKLLDTVLPTTKVTLQPEIFVVTAKGRLKAEVKKYSPPASDMSAKDLALLQVPGEAFPVLTLADSRSVQIGDPVHIIGFPGVVLSHELLSKSAMVESVVTNGAVSAIQLDASNNPLIQTDASASFGNSGGPVVNSRGTVVGVLTFVSLAPGADGNIIQGFNFVIPSAAVADFVRGTPVKANGSSKFNDVWFAGLTAFSGEDYSGALRRFEEADKLHPNLPDVKRKLAEAREFVKNPPPRPFPWFWVAIGVTLVSAGGFGGQWLHRWNKNRYRVQPSAVVKMQEEGKAPIVLDTRKADAYEQMPLSIRGSVRLAPEELASGVSGLELDTTRPVVAYCT